MPQHKQSKEPEGQQVDAVAGQHRAYRQEGKYISEADPAFRADLKQGLEFWIIGGKRGGWSGCCWGRRDGMVGALGFFRHGYFYGLEGLKPHRPIKS